MKNHLKEIFNRIFRSGKASNPDPAGPFRVNAFSQEGEDMILARIFKDADQGFYVDIGAHHPHRFSNTYYFYRKGWTGINIDPIPGIKQLFDRERPADINLEMAIGDTTGVLNYYNFKEKALNTFSESLAKQYTDGKWELENVIPIQTFPLADILDKYFPQGREISFMTIDVEDFELNVLQSNNWKKYRPKFLVIEMLDCSIEEVQEKDVAKFLKMNGYSFFAKTVNSSFFKLVN